MRTGSGQLQSHVKSFREGPRKESAVLSRTEHLPYSTLAPRHCERRGRELCAQRYGALVCLRRVRGERAVLFRTYDPLSVSKKRTDTARARRKGELARRGFGRASLAQREGTRMRRQSESATLLKNVTSPSSLRHHARTDRELRGRRHRPLVCLGLGQLSLRMKKLREGNGECDRGSV